jgi:acetate kinase
MILTINGGSSSIKFAAYSKADLARSPADDPNTPSPGTPGEGWGEGDPENQQRATSENTLTRALSRSTERGSESPKPILSGRIERVGTPDAHLIAKDEDKKVNASSAREAAAQVIAYIHSRLGADAVAAIGHRVVHGGLHLLEHQKITPDVLAQLRQAIPMDLAHLPGEIELIEAFEHEFPSRPQIACFDTAFFRGLPRVSQLLPIPRKLCDQGLRRFGFHGLSYTYLMRRLEELAGADAAHGRVILAHLGAGASMAAVRDGKPIDTTMAFTPTAGLMMATRPGDIDPGLLLYLMRTQNLSPEQMEKFISGRCGLLGVSQTSGDMRDLLARQSSDPRADDAVELFCHTAKKFVAALAATLGGIDTLVFSAGIGEHCPAVRAAICAGLEFLGIRIDAASNVNNAAVISSPTSSVMVRVIPTDEEQIIARLAHDISHA